jgi:hypothetical protein
VPVPRLSCFFAGENLKLEEETSRLDIFTRSWVHVVVLCGRPISAVAGGAVFPRFKFPVQVRWRYHCGGNCDSSYPTRPGGKLEFTRFPFIQTRYLIGVLKSPGRRLSAAGGRDDS